MCLWRYRAVRTGCKHRNSLFEHVSFRSTFTSQPDHSLAFYTSDILQMTVDRQHESSDCIGAQIVPLLYVRVLGAIVNGPCCFETVHRDRRIDRAMIAVANAVPGISETT